MKDINKICEEYSIKRYTINDDGSIDVNGEVDLSSRDLTELPLDFRNVTGSFNCSNNKLTSLKGCPKNIIGSFYCFFNKLSSLEFSPESIGVNFICNNNELTTLKGCTENVIDFICSFNLLTSFEFSPKVSNSFYCNNNLLTSLKYCPEYIPTYLDCSNNLLKSLKFSPYVGRDFRCNNNKIFNFIGFVEPGGNFYCLVNPIYNILKLFMDTSYIELLNEYDCIRGEDIIIDRLNQFLEEIDKPTVDSFDISLIIKDYSII